MFLKYHWPIKSRNLFYLSNIQYINIQKNLFQKLALYEQIVISLPR